MAKMNLAPGANLTGTQVYFGMYTGEDSNGPIKWYVVAADGDTVTLWTTTNIALSRYSENSHGNWVDSQICRWLNAGFLHSAFSTPERGAMAAQYSTVKEQGFSGNPFIPCQTVVLPSVEEMAGEDSTTGTWGIDRTTRQAYYLNRNIPSNIKKASMPMWLGAPSTDSWWLRTPGWRWPRVEPDYVNRDPFATGRAFRPDFAQGIGVNGSIEGHMVHMGRGVKPAFKLNLSRVLFASAAVGGKSMAAVGKGLVALAEENGPVKLTVIDADMPVPVIEPAGPSCAEFKFSGAAAGQNRYVSCLLADESGGAVWYGKLADCAAAGSGAFAVPLEGVVAGTYRLRIFCELADSDYFTDRAGASVDMMLTVDGTRNE